MSLVQFPQYDLDLDALDKTDDPDALPGIFYQLAQADNDFKVLPARQWIENFLYYAGLGNSSAIPTPNSITGNSLTNALRNKSTTRKRHIAKFFKACQVQASNATRQRPSIKVWPEADDETSERKAKMSNLALDFHWEEDFEDDFYYEAILWALLTPAVARKDFYDYGFNQARMWPVEEQVMETRQKMMMDGSVMNYPEQVMRAKMSPAGNPIMEQLPSHKAELVSAFRLIFNPSANWINTVDFIGDVSVKRIGWIRENYDRREEGYHPENIVDLKPSNQGYTAVMSMESALQQLAFGSYRTYRNFNYGNMPLKDGCVCLHFFIRPSASHPRGREIFIAGGKTLYDGPSTVCRDVLFRPIWHPYSTMCYERVPSRLWGTTYGEKLTDMTREYDQARSELTQMRKTFSKAKLMVPTGAGIDRDTATGSEEIWRYNSFAPDGAGRVAYLNPPPPPSTVLDDLKLQREEYTEISGVTEIMQGIRPQGVTTYRGLEVLREEASNAANNFIRMYENFIARSQFNKLEIIRKCMTKPDKNLTNALRIFRKVNHYVSDVDIVDFVGDDLAGFVKIEPYSTIGKSRLALQEKYQSAAQLGVLGDIVNDPELNTEYKRKMDIQGFDPPKNRQVLFQRYENKMMLEAEKTGQLVNPPVMQWHDDAIHIREIDNLLLDPTLQSKDIIIQSLIMHRDQHMQKMAMMAMEAAQQAAMQGQVPGAPGGAEGGNPPTMNAPSPTGVDEGVLFGEQNGFVTGSQPSLA